ncbi:unnamed protein product [Pylaiella littoralis]
MGGGGTTAFFLCVFWLLLEYRAGPAAVGRALEVALKMICNNTMRKAAQKEVALLKELAEHDPSNKKHCIRDEQMLKGMMESKGPVPARMVRSHMRALETMGGIRPHFTEDGQFMQQEPDPMTGKTTVRLVTVMTPTRPIKSDITHSKGGQDRKDTVADLADVLDKCVSLDPRQRMPLSQCSANSFLRRHYLNGRFL